jgi:hypothetical protein
MLMTTIPLVCNGGKHTTSAKLRSSVTKQRCSSHNFMLAMLSLFMLKTGEHTSTERSPSDIK